MSTYIIGYIRDLLRSYKRNVSPAEMVYALEYVKKMILDGEDL